MDIADLKALIGPPSRRPPVVRWNDVEAAYGLRFPGDYKELFDTYPSLLIDNFLGLRTPGRLEAEKLAQVSEKELEWLRRHRAEFSDIEMIDDSGRSHYRDPYPIYPESGGVLQWGSTFNGDQCMWLTDPDPGKWSIMIIRKRWWSFDGGLLDFLVGVLSKTVRCPLFPSSFPSTLSVEEED